ncbi:hypothetical protein F7725_021526 [Dissostichus mawsoni]|uniref:Uncharacterized protein n=1 Tax=Dissostichus mawsoni TaxID=36200 RepID=A0A7J5ZEP3_DISMA|nr:hypothetical protein F7725_021526 [Dissostichus mawsoni]
MKADAVKSSICSPSLVVRFLTRRFIWEYDPTLARTMLDLADKHSFIFTLHTNARFLLQHVLGLPKQRPPLHPKALLLAK